MVIYLRYFTSPDIKGGENKKQPSYRETVGEKRTGRCDTER